MRGLGRALGVLAVVVLAGCSGGPPPPMPATTTTTTAVTTTTTTASMAERMARAVEQAAIPRDGMAEYGFGAPTEQEYRSFWMLKPCMVVTPAEERYTNSLYRKWTNDRIDLRHTVMSFETNTGVEFLEQLRLSTAGCTEWEYDNGQRYDMVADVVVQAPAGVDGFHGFCVDTVEETGPARRCVAFLAYGNVVSSLYVIQRTAPLTASLDKLYEVLPLAVRHLTT